MLLILRPAPMKRSGCLQGKGSALHLQAKKKKEWFWKADVKNWELESVNRKMNSQMLDTGSLSHGLTELMWAYIFACDYILMESASPYLPNHSHVQKQFVKDFSEVGPCSTFQPVTKMIHKSVCSTKEAGWEHSACAVRLSLCIKTQGKKKAQVLNWVHFRQRGTLAHSLGHIQITSVWSMGKNSSSIPYTGRSL